MGRSKNLSVNRRNFLKRAATAGAAALVSPAGPAQGKVDESQAAKKVEPEGLEVLVTDHPGSDFMVDAIKSLGIEYVCSMPADVFRGLHESVVNYGGNQNPEFITCCNEESSVSMAHGYFNVEGKPLCIFAHCTVGLQHSTMAIADASFDHVPIYLILGDIRVVANNELTHGVGDEVRMVRDYTKWDDFPLSLEQFAKSAVHAYEIAMTPPRGPVILVADEELQEEPIPQGKKPSIPKVNIRTTLVDTGAVTEAARLLVEADLPVIIAGHAARTQAGVDCFVELAEALQAPFLEHGGRMNFPSQHPLNQSSPLRSPIPEADVILGFELGGQTGWWSIVHSFSGQRRLEKPAVKAGVKLINVSANNLYIRPNPKEAQRYVPLDVDIVSDTEVALPFLIEEVKRLITPSRKSAYQDRGAKFAAARRKGFQLDLDEAAYAWDASPISVARMCAEVWEQIKHEDWSVGAVNSAPISAWPLRLWTIDKHYQYIGSAGGGVGINAPVAAGAALANRKYGRLTVTFNGDGDMMVAPGVLWTAAHHHIPLLTIMHNNRAYQAEVMAQQMMACRHNRGIERARIGTTLNDPNIDFAKLAQSMGVYAEGPITDPKDLGPALKRAIAVVKGGEPALVDVVTQPR